LFQAIGKAAASRGRSAISVNGERAVLARVTLRDSERPRIAASFHRRAHDGSLPVLGSVELGGAPVSRTPLSSVMPENGYQMLLEELPNAPRDEMPSALGWRIRDRLDMELEDAVIEILDMPAQARSTGSQSAYAVVSSRQQVEDEVARIRAAGLKLDTIDLPELCMRNIAVRLPQDAEGVAFLNFTDEHGLLTVTRQGVLYLVRRLDIGALQLEMTPTTQVRSGLIPSICLELQRSLDYYETHYDLPSINELVLAPGAAMEGLKAAITEQLGLNVTTLDLAAVFDLDEPLDENAQRECLFAVGAALRADAPGGRER